MRKGIMILAVTFCLAGFESCSSGPGNGSGATTTDQSGKAGGTASTGSGSASNGDGTGNTTGGATGTTGASSGSSTTGAAGTAAGSNTTNQQHQPSRNGQGK